LYKSLENFTASVEASRKKEMMRSAAMQEYQVRVGRSEATRYACAMWMQDECM
jgi:hypothetical protein